MWHDMGWHGMWFGWIFWIVILALIVWIVVRLTANNQNKQQLPGSGETALDILKKRYAKGEISKEQFEQMKKDLQ